MTSPANPPEYNPAIPTPQNNIPESQGNFLGNFKSVYEAFVKNHVALDDPTNPGNHSVVELLSQQNSKSTQSQEIAIYSKTVPGQTAQLFMRYPSNGKEFQITEYQIYSIEPNPRQEAYFSFLPGGIIVYFGRVFSRGNTRFNISINPGIRTNLAGVQLAGIANITDPPNVFPSAQPNVSLEVPSEGIYSNIILSSVAAMPDQFYMFFGNL